MDIYMNAKRIAIIQGFADFHYEMIGYVLEYCLLRKQQNETDFDIFVTHSAISAKYEQLFNNIFETEISWKHVSSLDHEQYDVVILLTDDDKSYSKIDSILEKVICIDHTNVIRRPGPLLARVGTRSFPKRDNTNDWALPVFIGLSIDEKTKFLEANNSKIHVCCIGVSNIPFHPIELYNWFGDSASQVEFHFVARTVHSKHMYRNCPNVHIYENCDPEVYFEVLRKSTYVLCANCDVDYEEDMMTGALPIAFTFGCKLILPPSWQRHFHFKSALTYDVNNKIDLTDKTHHTLDPIFEEMIELLDHRNKTFDKYIFGSS